MPCLYICSTIDLHAWTAIRSWELPKKIYPYRSIGTPRRHQLRRLFICLYNYSVWCILQYTVVIQTGKRRLNGWRPGMPIGFYEEISSWGITPSIYLDRRTSVHTHMANRAWDQLCDLDYWRHIEDCMHTIHDLTSFLEMFPYGGYRFSVNEEMI